MAVAATVAADTLQLISLVPQYHDMDDMISIFGQMHLAAMNALIAHRTT